MYFSGVLVPKELSIVYGAIFGLTSSPIVQCLARWRSRVVDGAPLGSAPELQEAALSGGVQAGAEGASVCPHCAQGSRVHIDEPAYVQKR